MSRFLSLGIRHLRMLQDARIIDRRLDEARSVVSDARARALNSRDQFLATHESSGSALPDPDNPTPADVDVILAIAHFHNVNRLIERPWQRALSLWHSTSATRGSLRQVRLPLAAVFLETARDQWDQALAAVESNLAATKEVLDQSLPRDLVDSFDNPTPTAHDIAAALADYRANNAGFIAEWEHLETLPSASELANGSAPSRGTAPRGMHGGLPTDIARRVEQTSLTPGPLVATLRRYQEFGARYIVLQQRALLGDDMGLGKTVQVLAAMCHLASHGSRHFFVVAPNSVLVNWEREVRKHTELRPIVAHGDDRDASLLEWQALGGVAITTYGTLPKLLQLVPSVDLAAVDEAHFAKNPHALRSQAVKQLLERSSHAVLMTGTALENHLAEMQSLVLLTQPEMEQTLTQVMHAPSGLADPDRVVSALAPVYLRRTQADVLTELPERIVTDEWVTLDDEDRLAYRDAPGDVMSKRLAATRGNGTRSSAKYERLLELIAEHRQAKRKIVVFSFFRTVIDDVCSLVGGAAAITGDTTSTQRQRIIDSFTHDASQRVLVVQVDAGGVGINLQAAQVVILMEAQFKPSTEWQAIARVHRMGQSRTVNVHRLLARDTIEERLVELIATKASLFEAYAHDSSVRDASLMAIDHRGGLEGELQRLLDDETS